MKKIFTLLAAVCLLTGCTPLSPSPHGDVPESDTVTMSTQFPVYDKDIDRIQVIIENGGDTNLNYGVEWAMEVLQGDSWKQIPYAEGYAWIQPLISLMPGGAYSYYVSMDMLDYDLKNGTYRVVKEMSGQVYTAEFMIGESTVSADSPFGYVPLEDLPEDYSTEDAARDGCVVLYPDGTFENTAGIGTFLIDCIHGVDTQIRFAFTSSDTPDKLVLQDVILEHSFGMPRFHSRMDWCRQMETVDSIQDRYYACLVTDGTHAYLTNASDSAESDKLLHVFSEYLDTTTDFDHKTGEWTGENADWISMIGSYSAKYRSVPSAWSPDGLRHVQASPDDVLHFYVNINYPEGGSMGYTADLLNEKIPVVIKEFVWADETTVMIVCHTDENGVEYFGSYDTDEQKIAHWSTGTQGYRWEDGKIVIID